jgi:hypothetical protein
MISQQINKVTSYLPAIDGHGNNLSDFSRTFVFLLDRAFGGWRNRVSSD